MRDVDFRELDFDSMSAIAKQDPSEFERLRQAAIDQFIESAPPQRRKRLRGLQWQIDMQRRNRTPLSACLRISRMMWDHLLGVDGLLGPGRRQRADPRNQGSGRSARILPFPASDLHEPH